MLAVKTVEELVAEGKEDILFERYGQFTETEGTFRSVLKERKERSQVLRKSLEVYMQKEERIREVLYNSITNILGKLNENKKSILEIKLVRYKTIMEQVLLTIEALQPPSNNTNSKNFLKASLDCINDLIKHRKEYRELEFTEEFNKAVVSSYAEHYTISVITLLLLYKKGLIKENLLHDVAYPNDLYMAKKAGIINDQEYLKLINEDKLAADPFKYEQAMIGIIEIYNKRSTKQASVIQRIPTITLVRYFLMQERLKQQDLYYRDPRYDITIEDLQIAKLNLVKLAEKQGSIDFNKKEFIELYERILKYDVEQNIKEERIKKELLPTPEEIRDLYNRKFFDGQDMVKFYDLNAIDINILIQKYMGQYEGEKNVIELTDIEARLNEEEIYNQYQRDKISPDLKRFYNELLNEEIKKRISKGICEITQNSSEFETEVLDLYEMGIISPKDIKEFIPDIDRILMESYDRKLRNIESNRQEVLRNMVRNVGDELISSETASLIILEFDLEKDLIRAYDQGEFSKEVFHKFKELSAISIEELMKIYGEEGKNLGTKTILDCYSIGILSYEDFQELYNEGIIKEDEWFAEVKEDLIGFVERNGRSREEFLSIYIEQLRELYIGCMLSEEKLKELITLGGINLKYYDEIINSLKTQEVMGILGVEIDELISEPDTEEEMYSSEDYDLEEMPEITVPEEKLGEHIETGSRDLTKQENNKDYREIIDPMAREELFMYGYKAKRIPSKKINVPKDSAFENYEFYIIPEQDGTIQPNSIVIAERYYQSKETKEKFAYGNATYLFKLKDLARIFNKSNEEVEGITRTNKKNVDGAYRLNHGKGFAQRFQKRLSEIRGEDLKSIYMPNELKYIEGLTQNIDDEIGWYNIPLIDSKGEDNAR